jgi:hypothetical protein
MEAYSIGMLMPKSAGNEALEVADFVVHTIGRQVRRNLKERGTFVPDFQDIFHAVHRCLTSYVEATSVTVSEGIPHPCRRPPAQRRRAARLLWCTSERSAHCCGTTSTNEGSGG